MPGEGCLIGEPGEDVGAEFRAAGIELELDRLLNHDLGWAEPG
jgi:hypothetical protein